jgi:SPP1 family predicted phage head-tail adaptor
MYAARLNTRITIQRPETTLDPIGQPIKGWALVASTWASVEPLQGREFIAAQAAQSEVTIRLRLRYLSGVDSSCRVLLPGDRTLNIVAVIDERNRHRWMQLMCRELT